MTPPCQHRSRWTCCIRTAAPSRVRNSTIAAGRWTSPPIWTPSMYARGRHVAPKGGDVAPPATCQLPLGGMHAPQRAAGAVGWGRVRYLRSPPWPAP